MAGQASAGLGLTTEREYEVLTLVSRGLTNDEIAARLSISTETVKTHMKKLFKKWGAKNRAHLTSLYFLKLDTLTPK